MTHSKEEENLLLYNHVYVYLYVGGRAWENGGEKEAKFSIPFKTVHFLKTVTQVHNLYISKYFRVLSHFSF